MSRTNGFLKALRSNLAMRLLLATIIAASAFVYGQTPAAAQQGGLDPAPDPRVAGIEKDFLMGMIPHHRGAIMMSQMALQKASRPEVRELAQENIDSQTREMELMTNYLRDWYGLTPPEGNMMPEDIRARMENGMLRGLLPTRQEQMARMQNLEQLSGPAFDVEYMSVLTDHHAMAIMMTAPVLLRGHHAALYDLGGEIVKAQGEQIQRMRNYLESFYGYVRPTSLSR